MIKILITLSILPFLTGYIPANEVVVETEPKTVEATDKVVNTTTLELSKSDKAKIIIEIADKYEIRRDDILAMWHLESLTGDALSGDNGCSRGNFHINLCANPSTKDVVGDLETETIWVAKRLLGYNYKEDRVMAIAKYNLPAGGSMKYYRNVENRKQYIKKYLTLNYERTKSQKN